MLTPDQIAALRDACEQVADPIVEWLLRDIAERVAMAGGMTRTAAYELYRANALGQSEQALKEFLKKQLKVSDAQIEHLFRQAAEWSCGDALDQLGGTYADEIQQTVSAALQLAQDGFDNLTQTMGMVAPNGQVMPLTKAYQEAMDFAFQQVFTGAADYETAIRQATSKLATEGIKVVDYASGVHTSIEAATRRNIMGGLGLMNEKIAQKNHDLLGCDGWEISAHAGSAPDHEPYQGRQFSDEEFTRLNNSLKRRIGTLNCGHTESPIILGVNAPQYTDEELEELKRQNAQGITYQGRHYTLYEATQKQRQIERAQRIQKNRILVADATGDAQRKQTAQIRLNALQGEYKAFSKAAGLPTQPERARVAGFSWKEGKEAAKEYKRVAKSANLLYDTGSEQGNIQAWLEDQTIRKNIRNDPKRLVVNPEKQARHLLGEGYIQGRSYLTIDPGSIQEIVDQYAGFGRPIRNRKGDFADKELVALNHDVGVSISPETGEETTTNLVYIHYSKTGAHIVPTAKGKKS